MSARTAINWTDATWNPVVGCTKVSQGCKHCYAKTLHDRRHQAYLRGMPAMAAQYRVPFEHVQFIDQRLATPTRWRKPRRIFVNSVSDLFHPQLPDSAIAAVFDVMREARQHTYQILTKRPERLLEFTRWYATERMERASSFAAAFAHVHMGVSVEDQRAADARIPYLAATAFTVRWLSCEPLLGHVDLSEWLQSPRHADCPDCAGRAWRRCDAVGCRCEGAPDECKGARCDWPGHRGPIGWVVAGGESGRGARALDVDAARDLRDQCLAAGVPFWFKQVGGATPASGGRLLDGREWNGLPQTSVTAPRFRAAHSTLAQRSA